VFSGVGWWFSSIWTEISTFRSFALDYFCFIVFIRISLKLDRFFVSYLIWTFEMSKCAQFLQFLDDGFNSWFYLYFPRFSDISLYLLIFPLLVFDYSWLGNVLLISSNVLISLGVSQVPEYDISLDLYRSISFILSLPIFWSLHYTLFWLLWTMELGLDYCVTMFIGFYLLYITGSLVYKLLNIYDTIFPKDFWLLLTWQACNFFFCVFTLVSWYSPVW
jgi:hypothetical protein